MSLLLSVENKLAALKPALFQVESGLALAAVINRPPQAGVAAWVVPLGERPSADKRTAGPALQKVGISVGIVLAVRSVNDKQGNRGSAALEQARDAVRNALFGWTPDGALLPLLTAESDLIKMENSTIWWMDRYTTAIQRRAPQF